MKLNYSVSVSDESISLTHTPNLLSKKLPFYIQGLGHFYALSSYYTEREGLDNYLMIYTISGCGYLKYKNIEYMIYPNQVLLFYCYEYQFYKTASDVPWEFRWIHFNGASVKEYYDIINGDSLNIITIDEKSGIGLNIRNIQQASGDNDMLADIKMTENMTNILSQLIYYKYSVININKFSHHKDEIDKVINFIKLNYYKSINNDDFEKIVHISKFYFTRLFKSYIGVSPYEYLIKYRISISKVILKETETSVNEISRKVGFGDVNNFIRCFKKLVGTTPANYRKFWIS